MAISSTDPLAGPALLITAPKPPGRRRGVLAQMARHRTDYLWVAPALLVMLLSAKFNTDEPFVVS